LSALSILFFSTPFFGNFLIFVTLYKESSLHPPSKLFYRCLATTDLLFDYTITFWFGCVNTTISLTISMVSHAKIFRGLRSHSAQIPQQPSQTNTLNMARYRKAVYNALWVQLALVVCYL
ncbi:unnamed protein product, partial [Pocillopora meandrina]